MRDKQVPPTIQDTLAAAPHLGRVLKKGEKPLAGARGSVTPLFLSRDGNGADPEHYSPLLARSRAPRITVAWRSFCISRRAITAQELDPSSLR